MEIVHEVRNGCAIFKFNGNIEIYESEDIRKHLFKLITDKNYTKVVFNFENLNFIDSSGIGIFINLQFNFKNKVNFRFSNMKKNIKKVFEYTNLISCFDIDDTEETSLAKLQG